MAAEEALMAPFELVETRCAMRLTFQLTPQTPSPLLPTAPMMPATCVPWPWVSEQAEVSST